MSMFSDHRASRGGFKTDETWSVFNDVLDTPAKQDRWVQIGHEALKAAMADDPEANEHQVRRRAAFALSDLLSAEFFNAQPPMPQGIYRLLLKMAIVKINWTEIAEAILQTIVLPKARIEP